MIPWNKGKKRGPCPWVSESNKRRKGILHRMEIPCLFCGKEMKLTKYQTKKRKFCSFKCYIDFYKGIHFNMKNGEWCYRNIAFRFFKKKCYLCGKKENLIIHHKDKNHKNNKINNLIPLCRQCHNVVHNNKFFARFGIKYIKERLE